jgi:1-acyl-sn-glycerol-3-phosphate acyltransferase
MIARDGDLKGASEWLVDIGSKGIRVHGADQVPRTGPVLFVGNHAGLGDAHALFSASPRRDTHFLANDFGILTGLRAMRRHIIVVDDSQPLASFRASLRHLRAGKSLLLYPRGEIEADPALHLESALETLSEWSRSIEHLARHVPDLVIVPIAVGGVVSRRALRNPIVRQYRESGKRHFLAATFQMMFPFYRDPVISLRFGRTLSGEWAKRDQVLAQMAVLLRHVNAEQQELNRSVADRAFFRRF